MDDDWQPTCLCISAGNISLPALLGSLFALEKKGLLAHINSYASSGNGCFLSVLLCLGLSVDTIRGLLEKCKPSLFYDSHSYQQLCESKQIEGMDQFLQLKFFFTEVFEASMSIVPTFNQLYLTTGKKLYLTTYNMVTQKAIYLSRDTHPEMNLLTALHLTTGVHHITCDIGYDGDLHMDGASCNPLPLSCFPRHKKALVLKSAWHRSVEQIYAKTTHGYSSLLLHLAVQKLTQTAFRLHTGKSLFLIISLGSDEYTALDNALYLENKEQVIIDGYEQTLSALKHMRVQQKSKENVIYTKQ